MEEELISSWSETFNEFAHHVADTTTFHAADEEMHM